MTVLVVEFAKPEDVTTPGFDGQVFRFPFSAIDRADIGTPRQSSKIRSGRIRVDVSGVLIAMWQLEGHHLVKVAFELAKEHLTGILRAGAWDGEELRVAANSRTQSASCPFDPSLIHEPEGHVVEIEIKRPIGFITNA